MGCGCFLWVLVAAAWGIIALIFPKLPGYDEAMERGDVVPGKVLRVETVDNVTINDKHPRRVIYSYGDGQEGSMTMALDESASEGQALKVRVMGEQAYPEDIRPLAKPSWLKFVLIGGALLGTLFIALGVIRLLIIGGVLFTAGRSLGKGNQAPPPPPPPPPAPQT
jgi:hypothetical protein